MTARHADARRLVVVKVGGSLLEWPGLPARLAPALRERMDLGEALVLIVGGGRAADYVRDLDRTHRLGDVASHALALRALDLTAQALATLMGGLPVVERWDEARTLALARRPDRIPVLAPRRFLEEHDRVGPDPLPASWDVTTDTIAACLAHRLEAAELALLKSAPLPPGTDRRNAVRLGLVDPTFPSESRRLPLVTYRNLRDPQGTTIVLP